MYAIGNIGTAEFIVILIIALIFFGPRRLPGIANALGKSLREFRKALNEVKSEITQADVTQDIADVKRDIANVGREISPFDPDTSSPAPPSTAGKARAQEPSSGEAPGDDEPKTSDDDADPRDSTPPSDPSSALG